MNSPPTAPATSPLAERVRAVLAEEGRPPSRRAVAEWIRAGAVTVDGRILRNPDAQVRAAVRISLDLDALPGRDAPKSAGLVGDGGDLFPPARGVRGAGSRASAATVPPPPWLLHLDAQLVVVDRAGFPSALSAEAFAGAVSRALAAWGGRALVLVAVPDPSGPGSGPVLLATSKGVAARLAAAVRAGRVLETLLSLRSPPVAGSGEELLEHGEAVGDGSRAAWGLVQREGAPTAAAYAVHDLVPPHRAVLVLKHPKTNRRLEFMSEPCAAFAAALSGVGRAGPG